MKIALTATRYFRVVWKCGQEVCWGWIQVYGGIPPGGDTFATIARSCKALHYSLEPLHDMETDIVRLPANKTCNRDSVDTVSAQEVT